MTNSIKSITIGSFDGVHLAHKRLIEHADLVVVIERGRGYLTPGYKRSHFIEKPCAFYLFEQIKSLTPEAFVAQLKRDFPRLEKIVVGYDFHFGAKKSGDAQSLRKLFDGEVLIVDGISVHSRTIKESLQKAKIALVNRLLGRPYHIEGHIIKGQGIGSKELVPTLNLDTKEYLLPREGVYATRSLINERWFPSVSFLGHRVTTDGSFAVETHILDEDIGVVQGNISIEFMEYIRANQKFENIEKLKEAIADDIKSRRATLEYYRE